MLSHKRLGWMLGLPVLAILAAVIFLAGTKQPAQSQSALFFEPNDEYTQAMDAIANSRYKEATTLLNQVYEQNRGSQLAAAAKMGLAYIQERAFDNTTEALQTYKSVMTEFPNTPMGILAEMNAIGFEATETPERLKRLNEVTIRIGGVSLDKIGLARDERLAFAAAPNLPPAEQRALLVHLYNDMGEILSEDSEASKSLPDAISIYKFLREQFPELDTDGNFVRDIQMLVLDRRGVTDRTKFPQDSTPPRIRPIAPRDGQSIGNTQPKLEIELDDGDISESQVNLAATKFTLDGQDLTGQMSLQIQYNPSGQLGPVFERMRLQFRPKSPLATGPHTVTVSVVDHAHHSAVASWTFTTK